MKWLNKLPGYQRTPYGFELRLLKLLPHILLAGIVLPALFSWVARFVLTQGSAFKPLTSSWWVLPSLFGLPV